MMLERGSQLPPGLRASQEIRPVITGKNVGSYSVPGLGRAKERFSATVWRGWKAR